MIKRVLVDGRVIEDSSGEYVPGQVKSNLGCGDDHKEGFVNIDFIKLPAVDLVVDLEKKFSFKDNLVDEVVCENTIEHLKEPQRFMEEIYRVCKPGARVTIVAPHTWNKVLDGKLLHVRPGINALTFSSFDEGMRYNYSTSARFKTIKVEYKMFKPFHFMKGFCEKHKWLAEYYIGRWIGIDSCKVTLEVLKVV
jgi:predicted SAM-dependent methyltransferase